MDIGPLCGRLGLKACEAVRQKRMWQMGLAGVMHKPPLTDSVTQIIRTVLVGPVVKDLCRKTGKDVRYRSYGPRRLLSSCSLPGNRSPSSVFPTPAVEGCLSGSWAQAADRVLR